MKPLSVSEELLRSVLSLIGARAGRARMASMTPAERTELARRGGLFRQHGRCPFCESEPGTPEHKAACEGA